MSKKLLIGFICLILSFSILLVGCGGTKNNSSASTSPGTAPATDTPTAKPEAKKQPVALRVGVIGETLKGMDQLAKTYESQNPNVKIIVERAPDAQYESGLLAGLASHDAPDIFEYWGGNKLKKLASANYTEDLSGLKATAHLDPNTLRAFTFNAKVQGIPFGFEFLGLYYNKDIFTTNGWSIPKNWDEFIALLDKVKAKGLVPIAFMGQEGWAVQLPWYQMAPTLVYSKDIAWDQERYDNKVKFATTDAWKEAGAKYKTLLDKGYLGKNMLGVSYDQAKQLFSSGKAAMIIDGSWSLSGYKDMVKQTKMNISMFAFPANAAGQDLWLSKSTSAGVSIWSGSKVKDEAKKFYEFVMDDSNLVTLIGEGNISSSKTLKITTDPILDEIMPIAKNNNSYQFLDTGWPSGPQEEAFIKETQAALGGASTFDKVLETADKAWDKGAAAAK